MELFGIKNGLLFLSSGERPSNDELQKIIKAAATTLATPETEKKTPEKIEKKAEKKLSLKERKDIFYKRLIEYKNQHSNKYPSSLYTSFFDYWTQTDSLSNSEEMRFEKTRRENKGIFNFGGRLSTFWNNCNADQKNKMWMEHEKEKQKTQPTLL